jgi:hypothetical protein
LETNNYVARKWKLGPVHTVYTPPVKGAKIISLKKHVFVMAFAAVIALAVEVPASAQTFGDGQKSMRPASPPKRFNSNGVCINTRAGCIAGGVRRGFSRDAANDFCVRHNNGCN